MKTLYYREHHSKDNCKLLSTWINLVILIYDVHPLCIDIGYTKDLVIIAESITNRVILKLKKI